MRGRRSSGGSRWWAGTWWQCLVIAVAAVLGGAWAWPAAAIFAGFGLEEGAGTAREANGSLTQRPVIRALAVDGEARIHIDGRLDEDIWKRAQSACGFREWDPERGGAVTEQTVFKVAYDHDALYFAVACLEEDPSRIAKCLSRRDQMSGTDNVSVYIDPYHDLSTGYNFRVNPLGVQDDSYVYNDGNTDSDWDAVWEAETSQDGDGWYAEMRIPFSSIRYRAETPTWGLQVYRYMHTRGEDTAWVVWDRQTPGFVSRFGELEGMVGIPAPRQLELLPYAVQRATDPVATGAEDVDRFQNFGLDLKYGVTADMTLNATFQPDFGQVEADPAQLNLSPFETFYQEKRPFFVEGSRFFSHPNFNLFYSRRIGTGDENARIRYAAKLTGKTAGGVSVGALVAGTDITQEGQTHNFFKQGSCPTHYAIGRFGKEFNQGNQKVNVMQTAVVRDASRDECGDRDSREAYTSGMDFQLLFHDRKWAVDGSWVGSVIDPEALASDPSFRPEKSYGSGGVLGLSKRGGRIRAEAYGSWETDRLDLNDLGYLSSPDEISAGMWMGYTYEPSGDSTLFQQGNLNLNLNGEFLYAPRAGYDLHTGEPLWSYRRGHRAVSSSNVNGWFQLRDYREVWFGLSANPEGSQRWDTRRSAVSLPDSVTGIRRTVEIPGGGPLIDEPWTWGGWLGVGTDSRQPLILSMELNYYDDEAHNRSYYAGPSLRWNQSSTMNHRLSLGYNDRIDDTQHLANYENPGKGIGGVSYIYGDLRQKTLSMTLRTNVLFSRSTSLELYAQPYITVGDYRRARELMQPDSYDLRPYAADGFDVDSYDFSYASANLNAVFRWEYRPGSTLYLVWTQRRSTYDERGNPEVGGAFDGGLKPGALLDNEAENTFLVKVSYWLPI